MTRKCRQPVRRWVVERLAVAEERARHDSQHGSQETSDQRIRNKRKQRDERHAPPALERLVVPPVQTIVGKQEFEGLVGEGVLDWRDVRTRLRDNLHLAT